MNLIRYLLATLALFAFILIYEMLLHDFILIDMYELTQRTWRDFAEIEANISLAILFQLALSAWTAFIFTQIYPKGGIKFGLFFGLYFGVFAGILTATWYLWLNVPAVLGLSWFLSSLGEGLGGGLILGAIYRDR